VYVTLFTVICVTHKDKSKLCHPHVAATTTDNAQCDVLFITLLRDVEAELRNKHTVQYLIITLPTNGHDELRNYIHSVPYLKARSYEKNDISQICVECNTN